MDLAADFPSRALQECGGFWDDNSDAFPWGGFFNDGLWEETEPDCFPVFYLGIETMDPSQPIGADKANHLVTKDELALENAAFSSGERCRKILVFQEHGGIFADNGEEDRIFQSTGKMAADTRTENESIATSTKLPTRHASLSAQGADHECPLIMSREIPLITLSEDDSPGKKDARQHSDSEARDEPIPGPSSDERAEAPTATEDEKATAQDITLVTRYEASSDAQYEAMCAQQPSHTGTSEPPPDQPAQKEKAAGTPETVKAPIDDISALRASTIEEGPLSDIDPGSPPIVLPDVDEISQEEAAQAKYKRAAVLLYIFSKIARQDRGSYPFSKNDKLIQDRDFAISTPSAAVLCNSDSPEDARNAKRSGGEDSADETTPIWHTEQTCGPSDQGKPERGSQDNPIIVDDEASRPSSSKNARKQPRRPYRRSSCSTSMPTLPTSDVDVTDAEYEGTASSNQSLATPVSGTKRKRKFGDTVAWGDPDFEGEAASELDSTWQTAQIEWLEIQSSIVQLASADSELVAAATSFEKTMIHTWQATVEREEMDPADASRLNGAWKVLRGKLKGKGIVGTEKDRLQRFGQVLQQLEDCAGVLAVVQEHPHAAERKHESEDEDYNTNRTRRRVKLRR